MNFPLEVVFFFLFSLPFRGMGGPFREDIIRFILKFIGEIQVIQGGYTFGVAS